MQSISPEMIVIPLLLNDCNGGKCWFLVDELTLQLQKGLFMLF